MGRCNVPVGSGRAGIDSLDWVGSSFCEPHPGVVSGSSALTRFYIVGLLLRVIFRSKVGTSWHF